MSELELIQKYETLPWTLTQCLVTFPFWATWKTMALPPFAPALPISNFWPVPELVFFILRYRWMFRYNIMLECWSCQRKDRPKFRELHMTFVNLEDKVNHPRSSLEWLGIHFTNISSMHSSKFQNIIGMIFIQILFTNLMFDCYSLLVMYFYFIICLQI